MTETLDWHEARALLEWQIELGADEAIGEVPVDRFAAGVEAPAPAPARPTTATATASAVPVAAPPAGAPAPAEEAGQQAAAAGDLAALRAAIDAFPHCALRETARNLVFADGLAGARVMVVGEAPGRDEDIEGRPFVGRAGRLLDRMFAEIGLARDAKAPAGALYITNVLPWRPPGNRTPTPEEIAMMRPFLMRHIALASPEILVVMGNTACQALLGQKGIMRLRGHWAEAAGHPAMPMLHPAALLRNPSAKRAAWSDLLAIAARLGARP